MKVFRYFGLNAWGIAIFVLAFGFASVAFAQPSRKDKKGGLKGVKEHIFFEEFDEAIPELESLLQSDPDNAFYNYWMGKCLYITYKKNKALKYFKKVESVNPEVDKEFHWYYALTLHYNLMFDEAMAEYKLDLERFQPESDQYREVANRISQCAYARKMKMKKEGNLVKITNLGDGINTEFSEHSPVISANDSILVFTARRPECLGANPETHFYDEDLYMSYNIDNNWTPASNLGQPVNSKGHDATISLTADGKTLFIYRQKKAGGLYVADFDTLGKKWKEPRAVEKPLNSKYYETSICKSANDDLLFFTSDRPGGFGGKDVYWVRKSGDTWGEPQNLGPQLNTPFDEDSPYFHPDGKTLYFSSNGPKSIGGYDIFVTEWDSSGGKWLEPLNMGYPVNTADDDIYFVVNKTGLTGYYSSGKEGGFGEKDIYRIDFPYYRYPKRYYAVEVVGIVQDIESLDTLDAMVKLVDNTSGMVVDSAMTNPLSKQYYFELESGKDYTLQAFSRGYNLKTEQLSAPKALEDDINLVKDVAVVRPKDVPVFVENRKELPEIQHIYYDFDKDFLRKESKEELDRVLALLAQEPFVTVEIKAHTDWFNTFEYNSGLSKRRSKSAYNYFVSKGIDPSRITETWFSENTPIETNENDDGRQYNRRSEFRIFKNGQLLTASVKLRSGNEFPRVDHATPHGLPGFDNPNGRISEKKSDRPVQNSNSLSNIQKSDPRRTVFISKNSSIDTKENDVVSHQHSSGPATLNCPGGTLGFIQVSGDHQLDVNEWLVASSFEVSKPTNFPGCPMNGKKGEEENEFLSIRNDDWFFI